jgi:hypothetical protein
MGIDTWQAEELLRGFMQQRGDGAFGGFSALLPELAPGCMFELALFDSVSSGNAAPSCALRITQ